MHIYITRHGQSQHNAHKIVAGQQESPLTLLGREQAKKAGLEAAKLGVDFIVCSPMGRARATAGIIAETIDYPAEQIVIMPELRERGLGALEGKSYAHNFHQNGNYPGTEKVPGVESIELLHQRVNHVLHILLQSTHKNVLVVCHMNIGRMLHAIAARKPALGMYETPRLENATIYKLL